MEKDPDRKMDPNGVKIAHQSHCHTQVPLTYSAEHSTEYKITQNTVNHKKVSKHKSYKYIPSNQNLSRLPTRATGTLNIYSAEHIMEYEITQNTVNHKKYPNKDRTNTT